MASQEQRLCFVTWNTRGIKTPTQKLPGVLSRLRNLKADVAFIQETRIGTSDCQILENVDGWKVYFTVYSSRSKGVAILIRDTVPFKYICHDEDYSGGYIVLFCHLYGELYTLVNIYNHKDDRHLLLRLKEYLKETADGVLVVGGDFNTVLNPSIDRHPPPSGNESLKPFLKKFAEELRISDTWSKKHTDTDGEYRFTREQSYKNKSGETEITRSRIDMFFLPEDIMEHVDEIQVENGAELKDKMERGDEIKVENGDKLKKLSDHHPLVLTLTCQVNTTNNNPDVATNVKKSEYKPGRRIRKISGAEILRAIKTLSDTEEHRADTTNVRRSLTNDDLWRLLKFLPVAEEHKPDMMNVRQYITDGKLWRSLTETLKTKYNDIMRPEVPEEQQLQDTRISNLIFSEVLTKRLNAVIPLEKKCDICVIVFFKKSRQKIKWSFLEKRFKKLYQDSKYLNVADFAQRTDLCILNHLLPKTQSSSEDQRELQPESPLTKAILNLALKRLDQMIRNDLKCRTEICFHKHSLLIHAQKSKKKATVQAVRQFQAESGVRLRFKY